MPGEARQHVQADAEDHHADEAEQHEVSMSAQGKGRQRGGKCEPRESEESAEQGVGERSGDEPAIAREHMAIVAVRAPVTMTWVNRLEACGRRPGFRVRIYDNGSIRKDTTTKL